MGQRIELETRVLDDVLLADTDRSITGQDGEVFASPEAAAGAATFPARLAERLFAAVAGVDHVFVASNQVVVRRPGGWSEEDRTAAVEVIAGFFLYY